MKDKKNKTDHNKAIKELTDPYVEGIQKGAKDIQYKVAGIEQDEPISTKMAPKISTNPEAEQALKEAKERTPEEKQRQHEKAYGMSEEKSKENAAEEGPSADFPEFTKEELQKEQEQTHAAAELQRKAPLLVRESLVNFAIEQEMLLRIHDELKGTDGWLDGHPLLLTAKLMEEVGELAEAILEGKAPAIIRREAADVGNIAMMIAHKSGHL